jgi:phage shock protein PspC (stress-responsive transcriptional regulator)
VRVPIITDFVVLNIVVISLRVVALLLGWALFGYVAHQAYLTPSPEVSKWNPFDILGIADVSGIDITALRLIWVVTRCFVPIFIRTIIGHYVLV